MNMNGVFPDASNVRQSSVTIVPQWQHVINAFEACVTNVLLQIRAHSNSINVMAVGRICVTKGNGVFPNASPVQPNSVGDARNWRGVMIATAMYVSVVFVRQEKMEIGWLGTASIVSLITVLNAKLTKPWRSRNFLSLE